MNSTTLRGIFPEPKPIHRRNFMRENVRYIKQMQGLVPQEEPSLQSQSQLSKTGSKYKNVPSKVYSNMSNMRNRSKMEMRRPSSLNTKKPMKSIFVNSKTDCERKTMNRAVQTERPEDVPKLFETGALRYPTQSFDSPGSNKKSPRRTAETQGDSKEDEAVAGLSQDMKKLSFETAKPNYIKENIRSLKTKAKIEEPIDPNLPPAGYQKGAIPKYIKERKEGMKSTDARNEGYPGLLLLADEERREYLRVARESYASLIKELNSMPVRNDTLRRRNRKIEIEDELKRLEEVIKIFQKPKVFVKADT